MVNGICKHCLDLLTSEPACKQYWDDVNNESKPVSSIDPPLDVYLEISASKESVIEDVWVLSISLAKNQTLSDENNQLIREIDLNVEFRLEEVN